MADEAQATAQTLTLPFSLEALKRLPTQQKVAGLALIAFAISLLVGVILWSNKVEYSVLFSNLSDRDGGQIVATLQQMNVPYKFSEGGSAVLVPTTHVHDTRLRLASQGLPKGGLVGFEVMENQKLGASQFLEQINYQRALEGELARSIQSIQAVQSARVHLAIPKSSAFLRDEQKPTASVVVGLYPGRALEPSQIAGIVHLVSSSVPQLTPTNISVIDQNGNLVSPNPDNARDAGLNPSQLKYVRDLEKTVIKRIEAILEPVVGATNLRAQVAADIDFSQTEQMAESYTPNPPPNTAIRSQQTAESGNAGPSAAGVPGALSNQPPVPATAPITTPAAPGAPGFPPGGTPQTVTKNATTNYELDKTIRHTKGSSGIVKRLSVAVVVNQRKGPPDKESKSKPMPLTDAEMQQVTNLVREAMGYDKERGDTLNVANVPFTATVKEEEPSTPFWKDPEFSGLLHTLMRDGIKILFFAIIALVLWVKLFKPLFQFWLKSVAERRRLEELANQKAEEALQHHEPVRGFDEKLAEARQLAHQDPKMIASIIQGWISGGHES